MSDYKEFLFTMNYVKKSHEKHTFLLRHSQCKYRVFSPDTAGKKYEVQNASYTEFWCMKILHFTVCSHTQSNSDHTVIPAYYHTIGTWKKSIQFCSIVNISSHWIFQYIQGYNGMILNYYSCRNYRIISVTVVCKANKLCRILNSRMSQESEHLSNITHYTQHASPQIRNQYPLIAFDTSGFIID